MLAPADNLSECRPRILRSRPSSGECSHMHPPPLENEILLNASPGGKNLECLFRWTILLLWKMPHECLIWRLVLNASSAGHTHECLFRRTILLNASSVLLPMSSVAHTFFLFTLPDFRGRTGS